MADLSTKQRKNLKDSDFAIPSAAPGPGSYPIPDLAHARNALARASGKPEEAKVKAAVYKKFPQLKPSGGGGKLQETRSTGALAMRLSKDQVGNLSLLEAKADAEDAKDGGADESTEDLVPVKCPGCGKTVKPNADGDCPNCGQDLAKVEAAAQRMAGKES